MTHHDLALESPYSFKGNTDNDEDRRTADADTSERGNAQRQNDREYCHDTEEYSADQGDLVERVVDEIRSGLARTITGDSAVVLLQVVCDLNRIVLNRYIEVVECDDEQEVDHCVQRSALVEHSEESTPETLVLFRDVEEVEDRLRKAHQGHCEDDRHNTGHSDLDRNVGGLTAVHLSALNLFCVLNAYLSFGKFYPYDRAEYDYDYKDITYETKQTYSVKRFAEEYRVEFVYGERRSRRYDTRKDQKRYTVGNAVIGNSFAYPHGNASTRGIEQNNYYVRKEFNETGYVSRAARQNCRKRREFAVIHRFLTVTHQNTDRLYDCKEQGQISRIVGDFLSAFFALLRQSFQRGDRYGEKLDND